MIALLALNSLSPVTIALGIAGVCLLLALNVVRQASRVKRVTRPEPLSLHEASTWEPLTDSSLSAP